MAEHTEYTTLSAIIDLSPQSVGSTAGDNSIGRARTALSILDESIAESPFRSDPRYIAQHNALYSKIWMEFDKAFLSSNRPATSKVGKVFCDFRGLILGSRRLQSDGGRFFQAPGWRPNIEGDDDRELTYASRASHADSKGGDWPGEILNHFWQWITVADGARAEDQHQYTVSHFLGGNVIYCSSLGAQDRSEQTKPLIYFMYSRTRNGWQLGRLVDLLHHLGTVRLAAIQDVPPLRTASLKLRRVEANMIQLLEGVRAARTALREKMVDKDERKRVSNEKFYGEELELLKTQAVDISQKISEYQQSFESANAAFTGGIAYRLDRSMYYHQQFQDGLKNLRIGRLEGFRPYDEFVRRGLGDAFDFVTMLRSQVARIFGIRDTLIRSQQLTEDEIIARETAKRSQEIEHIQELADWALWVVLAPYYIGTFLIVDFLNVERGPAELRLGFPLLWGLIAIGPLFKSWRRAKSQKPTTPWGRASPVLCVVALLAIFGSLAALAYDFAKGAGALQAVSSWLSDRLCHVPGSHTNQLVPTIRQALPHQ